MLVFQELPILQKFANRAFEAFFEHLINDTRLSSYFEDNNQIDKLVTQIKESFVHTLTMEIDEIKKLYTRLGKFHYNQGVHYVAFISGVELLEKKFLQQIAQEKRSANLLYESVEYFKLFKFHIAKGYLEQTLRQDRKELETFDIQLSESQTYLPKESIEEKIEWLKNLISYIQHNRGFNQSSTKVSKEWFWQIKKGKTQLVFLEHLENLVQSDTQELFHFLKQEEYPKVFFLYNRMMSSYKLMLNMSEVVSKKHTDGSNENIQIFDNEEFFNDILHKEFAFQRRDSNYIFSIIYLSCDNLDEIKAKYGEHGTTHVLTQISEMITEHIRTSDYGFHLHQNKFAIILKNAKRYIAQKIAKKIAHDFSEYRFFLNNDIVHSTLSGGISEQSHASRYESIEILIDVALQNLARAQELGGNQIVI
ncbi:MAG: diguanylate cyclase [Campylobacterales bacterium]|nr:diguanylate cyclase [Campylobacterales bacterium]